MKKLIDYINEGYWGCGMLQNDYVLDRQTPILKKFYKQLFNNVKYNDTPEELFYNLSIALDFCERMYGTEASHAIQHEEGHRDFFLKCLDKVYNGMDGWKKPEEWTKAYHDMSKKIKKYL